MNVGINLNKKIVTKEGILIYIQDADIYRFYTGQPVDLTKNIKSPLRDDDNTPSFGYFIGSSGEICFNDFGKNKGDCVKFVELYFGLSFFEALSKIVVDFNLTHHFIYKDMFKTSKEYNPNKFESRAKIISTANRKTLGKKARPWKAYDLAFWEQFGITKETLLYFKVEPIEYIFFDGEPLLADKFAYAFNEFKDNKRTIKIYQPFNENYKWLNNHNNSVWQGWDQLPKEGNKLIITSSLKDSMSIVDVLNIPSVSLQSESVIPKTQVIDELKSRFKTIYLLYDNDFDKPENIGEILGKKVCEQFNILQLYIPKSFKSKDFSDLVKKYGREEAKEIYQVSIEIPY